MVPDRQKVWTDGMDERTDDAKTISLRLIGFAMFAMIHLFNCVFCLFVWFDALHPSQQLWSCRDGQVHLTTLFY